MLGARRRREPQVSQARDHVPTERPVQAGHQQDTVSSFSSTNQHNVPRLQGSRAEPRVHGLAEYEVRKLSEARRGAHASEQHPSLVVVDDDAHGDLCTKGPPPLDGADHLDALGVRLADCGLVRAHNGGLQPASLAWHDDIDDFCGVVLAGRYGLDFCHRDLREGRACLEFQEHREQLFIYMVRLRPRLARSAMALDHHRPGQL
mmetsp:Transcript_76591/g.234518  ORF Transcript_76591/g.234518 Transcript_76591/m.234518 type:complete len:204 (-) Transcript_76591:1292-1903(-)